MTEDKVTPFSEVYDIFFSKITDDFYMEITEEETQAMAQDLLLQAIPSFEFPKVPLDYELDGSIEDQDGNIFTASYFTHELTKEEENILATYMVVAWLGQQLASVELVRMKYSGTDFKFTSQANHLAKLNQLKKDYTQEGFHLQRLYKRRFQDKNGVYHSSFTKIMEPLAPLPKGDALDPSESRGKTALHMEWDNIGEEEDDQERDNWEPYYKKHNLSSKNPRRVGRILEGQKDGS